MRNERYNWSTSLVLAILRALRQPLNEFRTLNHRLVFLRINKWADRRRKSPLSLNYLNTMANFRTYFEKCSRKLCV